MSLTHLQIRDALHQPCRLRLHSLKCRLGRLLAHLMRAGSGEGVIPGTAELTATQNEAPCSTAGGTNQAPRVQHKTAKLGSSPHPPSRASFPNSPILSPPKPYIVLRDTLCSCDAYGMRPMYKRKNAPKGSRSWQQ